MTRTYNMTLDYAMNELPLARAFALQAAAIESNPWITMERATDGYIAQEAAKLRRK